MKAILVIDEMPETCGKCRLADFGECRGSKSYIHMPTKGRPKECPLRPLPEKQKLTVTGKNQIEKKRIIKSKSLEQIKKGFINNSEVAFYCGYNACLDEITGENNE